MIEEIFKNLQTILIVVLVAVVLFMRNCDKPTPTEPKEIIKTRVEYINVRDTIPQYIPKWKDRVIVVTDTIKEPIDTSLVLTDYYSKYYYEDTLTIDTMGFVYVKDTVTQNKIVSRNLQYHLEIPKITIEKTTFINEREFYVGPTVIGNRSGLNNVGTEILMRTKKSQLYSVGVGINAELQPTISGGIYWKLGR